MKFFSEYPYCTKCDTIKRNFPQDNPTMIECGIIYKLKCNTCNSTFYSEPEITVSYNSSRLEEDFEDFEIKLNDERFEE